MGEKGGENLLAPEFSAPWLLRGETGKQPRGDRGSAGQPYRGHTLQGALLREESWSQKSTTVSFRLCDIFEF